MAAPQSLEELVQYIKETLPQSKAMTRVHPNAAAKVVTFGWQGHEFLVKQSLEVLEVRANNLYVTGASMLMQLAFLKRDKNQRVIEAIVDTLHKAEDVASSNPDNALALVASVKQTLQRLIAR